MCFTTRAILSKEKNNLSRKISGVAKLEIFPPVCHGELSVNDNHYHALVKQAWRSERSKNGDERVRLYFNSASCDRFQGKAVPDMYIRNFMLMRKSYLSKKPRSYLQERRGDTDFRRNRFEKYIADYEEFSNTKKDIKPMVVPKKLRTDLGPYWADPSKMKNLLPKFIEMSSIALQPAAERAQYLMYIEILKSFSRLPMVLLFLAPPQPHTVSHNE